MKFGKSLSSQIEKTLPEWRDKFLSYKELKKKLKNLEQAVVGDDRLAKRLRVDSGGGNFFADVGEIPKEESDFRNLLENELEKFNNFFVEKEEEVDVGDDEREDRSLFYFFCFNLLFLYWFYWNNNNIKSTISLPNNKQSVTPLCTN